MKFKKVFRIHENLAITIKRKSVKELILLKKRYKILSVTNSAFLYFYTLEEDLLLPKLYAALTYLTGVSDSWYDEYKGSYSFSFELEVKKNNLISNYVYHVFHYRSFIDFSVFRLLPKSDPRDENKMHNPDDDLFSDFDICYFSNYFCNYSLGYVEGANHIPKPFVKNSDSNLLLFGFLNDEYFIRAYEEQRVYDKEKIILGEARNKVKTHVRLRR